MNTEEQVGGTREERAKWTSVGEERKKKEGQLLLSEASITSRNDLGSCTLKQFGRSAIDKPCVERTRQLHETRKLETFSLGSELGQRGKVFLRNVFCSYCASREN